MSQPFHAYSDDSHVNTVPAPRISTPDNLGLVESSARCLQSHNNTFRQRWQRSSDLNTMSSQNERASEPLESSLIVEQSAGLEDEEEVPPSLPPRSLRREKQWVKKRRYSDFEYGTMCFLALCTFLCAMGLVIALIVGALDILSRLLQGVGCDQVQRIS